jgi:post-segregation antitoxin (ccd killing protein)
LVYLFAMETIATKISLETKARATAVAKRRRLSLSGLLRRALENEIRSERPRTWGERFAPLEGAVKHTPANLSEIEGFD